MNMKILMMGVVGALSAGLVQAGNPQFNKGPVCVDDGKVATCSMKLTGLGNGDLDVAIRVISEPVEVSTLCKNPKGKLSPGQNPAAITDIGGDLRVPASSIKNGSVTLKLSTDTPPDPTWSEAGCPNSQWKASIADVIFVGETVEITVMQDGILVLQTQDLIE